MNSIARAEGAQWRSLLVPATVVAAAIAVQYAAAAGVGMGMTVGIGAAAVAAALLVHHGGLEWRTFLCGILGIIIFIPIGRYSLPGSLPFEVEPYRIAVALAIAIWLAALLIDPRVRLRASGLELAFAFLVAATLASVIANPDRVSELSSDVAKSLTFLASFLLFFFMFVSVVRDRRTLDGLIKLLVGGGAIVAILTAIESRAGYNVFDHLSEVVPILENNGQSVAPDRGGLLRAYGSAQHPIAMGATFVMLIPLGFYLIARTSRRYVWGAASVALLLGSLATVSKTSVIMLAAIALVFLWMRPRETKRLLPLVIPLLLVVHIVLPGTIGGLKSSFFPEEGFIESQKTNPGTYGSGRLADVGPALEELREQPFVGKGYGTLITEKSRANAPILDDQWLGTLLEIGALGALAWVLLLAQAVRMLGKRAREDLSSSGMLAVGLAATITAFAIGMFTFDSFAFIQMTFLLFVTLALGATTLRLQATAPEAEAASATNGSTEPVPAGGGGYG